MQAVVATMVLSLATFSHVEFTDTRLVCLPRVETSASDVDMEILYRAVERRLGMNGIDVFRRQCERVSENAEVVFLSVHVHGHIESPLVHVTLRAKRLVTPANTWVGGLFATVWQRDTTQLIHWGDIEQQLIDWVDEFSIAFLRSQVEPPMGLLKEITPEQAEYARMQKVAVKRAGKEGSTSRFKKAESSKVDRLRRRADRLCSKLSEGDRDEVAALAEKRRRVDESKGRMLRELRETKKSREYLRCVSAHFDLAEYRFEVDRIQGSWIQLNGHKVFRYRFVGETIIEEVGYSAPHGGIEAERNPYLLDPTKTPKWITWGTNKGVYKIEAGLLTICFGLGGGDRPKEFIEPDAWGFLWIFRRED